MKKPHRRPKRRAGPSHPQPPKTAPGIAPPAGTRPIREDLVRAAVLEAYAAVRLEGHLADRTLDRILRRESRLYSGERRAVAESLYGLLRQEKRIDFGLFGREKAPLSTASLHALRLAGLAVLEGRSPEEVLRTQGLPAGLASRLENVPRPLPASLTPLERVEIEGSLPDFLAKLLVTELGAEGAVAFTRAVSERAPLTVRANLLKTDRAALVTRLVSEGVSATPTRFSPLGATLESRVNAFSLDSFREGLFEVQDEGSQLLALIVGAKPGERVVDACAGAGGKTLALAADMKNSGELWALDVEQGRLDELSRRARRAGVHNVRSREIPPDARADAALADLQGRADRVLIDAPCTGLGTLRRNPDARYRFKPGDLETHAARQRDLIRRFARLVKPGGLVVYATCSIARLENEDVVEDFLRSGAPFELVPALELLPKGIDPTLASGPFLRPFPHRHGTDGFFAAALRRIR